jgi:hypothetical protein
MPRKALPNLTDEERAKRILETAREINADATAEEFQRVFEKIVPNKSPTQKSDRRDGS